MAIKHYKILISNSVKIALLKQLDYIFLNSGSFIVAERWLGGIMKSIQSLSNFPKRCPIAPESYKINKNHSKIIRHFIYKKSFRIIFTIVQNEVRILSIKHGARNHVKYLEL